MELEGSLPYPQEPATGPCPGPTESAPHPTDFLQEYEAVSRAVSVGSDVLAGNSVCLCRHAAVSVGFWALRDNCLCYCDRCHGHAVKGFWAP
jgi:hypothetical protein